MSASSGASEPPKNARARLPSTSLPMCAMRQAIVVIWYPIKDQRQLRRFYQQLVASNAPKLLRVELLVHPADDATRLNGSGLVIANPPWGLEEALRSLLPWLAQTLAQSSGDWRLDWLIGEQPAS